MLKSTLEVYLSMKTDKLLIIKHGSIGDIFMSLILLKQFLKNIPILPFIHSSGHKIFEFYKYNFKKFVIIEMEFLNHLI